MATHLVVISLCAGSIGAQPPTTLREHLIVQPFNASVGDAEPHVTQLCTDVQRWMEEWKAVEDVDHAVWGKEALQTSRTGQIVWGMEPSKFRRTGSSRIQSAYERVHSRITRWSVEGESWVRLTLDTPGFADFATSCDRYLVVRERQASDRSLRILDAGFAWREVPLPRSIDHCHVHDSGAWIGLDMDAPRTIIGGRIAGDPPELNIAYHVDPLDRPGSAIARPWDVSWTLDGRFAVLATGQWIETATGRTWLAESTLCPAFRNAGARDMLIVGKRGAYHLTKIAADGGLTIVDKPRWGVLDGDALWWVSPLGNYVGGRNNDTALALPGAYGGDIVRETAQGVDSGVGAALGADDIVRGWIVLPTGR